MNRIRESVAGCAACGLAESRTFAVPGEGSLAPKFVLVGEAPGKDEDACGRPFVGRCGAVLRASLAACSVDPEDVFICNAVKCRPSRADNPMKDRPPEIDEMRPCSGFLRRQLLCLAGDGSGWARRTVPVLAVGRTALRWFVEFAAPEDAAAAARFPRTESGWKLLSVTSLVEASVGGAPNVFRMEGDGGTTVRFEVYPIWHPGYVLNGGGGRVTRGVFAETMRAIVGRMLVERPPAEKTLAGA
jgi:uracil-DNA glycosylase family 4